MKKEIYLYPLFYIISSVLTAGIALFVPPVWVMCDCPFNTIKGVLIFPGSLIVSILTVYFVHVRIKNGASYWDAFKRSLLYVSLSYVVLNIANMLIFG